jgi:hypothetical protein
MCTEHVSVWGGQPSCRVCVLAQESFQDQRPPSLPGRTDQYLCPRLKLVLSGIATGSKRAAALACAPLARFCCSHATTGTVGLQKKLLDMSIEHLREMCSWPLLSWAGMPPCNYAMRGPHCCFASCPCVRLRARCNPKLPLCVACVCIGHGNMLCLTCHGACAMCTVLGFIIAHAHMHITTNQRQSTRHLSSVCVVCGLVGRTMLPVRHLFP